MKTGGSRGYMRFMSSPWAQFRLTLAQKVLLMYNTTGINRHSCISMFKDDLGHLSQALFSQVPFYRAFDWEFIFDHKDRYRWFELQWKHMVESLYFKSVLSTHQIDDFQVIRKFGFLEPRNRAGLLF